MAISVATLGLYCYFINFSLSTVDSITIDNNKEGNMVVPLNNISITSNLIDTVGNEIKFQPEISNSSIGTKLKELITL